MRRASIYIYIISCIYILYIELQIVQLGKERRRIRASVSRLYSYCRDDIYIYIYISWNYKLYNCRREEEGKRMLAFIELYVCIVEMILFIYTYRISSMYRITNCTIEERKKNASCGRGGWEREGASFEIGVAGRLLSLSPRGCTAREPQGCE